MFAAQLSDTCRLLGTLQGILTAWHEVITNPSRKNTSALTGWRARWWQQAWHPMLTSPGLFALTAMSTSDDRGSTLFPMGTAEERLAALVLGGRRSRLRQTQLVGQSVFEVIANLYASERHAETGLVRTTLARSQVDAELFLQSSQRILHEAWKIRQLASSEEGAATLALLRTGKSVSGNHHSASGLSDFVACMSQCPGCGVGVWMLNRPWEGFLTQPAVSGSGPLNYEGFSDSVE